MKAFCPRRPTVRTLRAAHARARVGSDRQAWGAKQSEPVSSARRLIQSHLRGGFWRRGLSAHEDCAQHRGRGHGGPSRDGHPWQAGASASTPWGFHEVSRPAEAPVRGSDRPQPCETSGQPRASGEDRRAELLSPGVLAAGQTQVPTMEPGAQPMARGDGGRTTPLPAHVTQKPCKARAESWGAGWREGCRGLGSTFPEDAAPGAGRLRARSSQKAGVGTPLPRSGPGGRWVTAAALGSRADSGTAEDGSRRGSPPWPTPLPVATPLPLSGEVRAFLSLRR